MEKRLQQLGENVFSRVEELGIPKKEAGEGRTGGGRRVGRREISAPSSRSPSMLTLGML